MMQCPCGHPELYQQCCGRFIDQQQMPATAGELMRSRYTAYATGNIDYIENTMRGRALQGFNRSAAQTWAKSVTWLGLQVLKEAQVTDNPNRATVEFIASYQTQGQLQRLQEISVFARHQGKWFYIDSNTVAAKPGRNEPCECGSGKKYKKCCG
ncbi:MAG: YchJ family protein [Legionellales bacterium]|nr:YchJ family protein [Legionellales bacterium]